LEGNSRQLPLSKNLCFATFPSIHFFTPSQLRPYPVQPWLSPGVRGQRRLWINEADANFNQWISTSTDLGNSVASSTLSTPGMGQQDGLELCWRN
jgi:hypothetical protein